MPRKKQFDIIQRWEGNPVVNMEDLSFPASDICNAGAVKMVDTYLLLITIESLRGHKSLYLARSTDSHYFEIDDEPFIIRSTNKALEKYEAIGVMDGRITPFGDTYYITYTAESQYGFRMGLARTDDFEQVTNLGLISAVDTNGGTLLP